MITANKFNRNILVAIFVLQVSLYLIFRNKLLNILDFNLSSIEIELLGAFIAAGIVFINTWITNIIINLLTGSRKNILKKLNHTKKWLLAAPNAHWGTSINDSIRKPINTIDGLFSIIYYPEPNTENDQEIVKEVVNYLLQHADNNGIQSFSLEQSNSYFTSVVLFHLLKIKELRLYSFNESELEKLAQLYKSLKNSYTPIGWGTYNFRTPVADEIRVCSTFWALRAINYFNGSDDELIKGILLKYINRVPSCEFGFTLSDTSKLAPLSLFLILISELKTNSLKELIEKNIDFESLIKIVLKKISSRVLIEIEEYQYWDSHFNNAQRKSFVHVSIGLSIYALSVNYEFLKINQKILLKNVVNRILRNNYNEKYFVFDEIKQDKNNPYVFTSAYMCMGISKYYEVVRKK